MKISNFIMLLLMSSVCCERTTDSTESVRAVIKDSRICVNNGLKDAIGYLAVDQKAAAAIDFAITCTSADLINSEQEICYNYNEISGYNTQTDTILIYWWVCKNGIPGGLNTIKIGIK